MAKKFLLGMMAFATLFATSCTNEQDPIESGNTVPVSFKVETPTIVSRAYSDGKSATVLQYAVYDENGEILPALTVNNAEIKGSTTVNLQLTTGNTYSVIFWAAAAKDAPYTVNFDNKTMEVSYTDAKSNDESRDAFYKYHTFTVKGAQTETIELKRPFAQLNIGTSDYKASTSAGYTPTQSAVTVKNIYNKLNLVDGTVSGDAEVTFGLADIKKDETFPVAGGYEYLAMNYLLVDADKETVDVEFTYTDGADAKTCTVGSVPVQRNYRTNIYGQLLTSDVDINVEIKPDYEKPDYDIVDAFVNQLTEGGLVTLKGDIVLTDYPEGLIISNNTEINLDGHTLTLPDVDASSRKALITVDDTNNPVNLTIKNGKLVVESTNEKTNGKGASTGGSQVINYISYGKLVLENVKITGSQRGGHRAIDAAYGEVELNNCKIDVNYGSAVNSNDAKVVLNNCDITINGMYSAPYNSVCFSAMYGGELTVNGGNYKLINDATYTTGNTHGGWVGIVMSSGGTIILNDGTFENVPAAGFNPAYERAIIEAENNAPAVSTVVFAGGKYKPQSSKIYAGYGDQYYPTWVNQDKLTLGADGWYTVADYKGYTVIDGEYRVSTGAGFAAAVTEAPADAKITLTADVDLTGVDYTPRSFSSLVFDGQNYTISGVKVENANQAALFGKTWKFDIQNVTLANSIFTGQNKDGEDSAAGFIAFLQTTYDGSSQIVNCHVKNCTIGSAKYVGGIVAYKDGTKSIKIDNCSVKDSKLVSKYTEDGTLYKGHIGGMIGYLCGDDAVSTVTNCVVENNTFEVLGARGGLFIGTAQANYNVSGKIEGNTGLVYVCGEINKITNWNNVACTYKATTQAEFETALTKKGVIKVGEGNYTITKFSAESTIIGTGKNTVLNAQNIITVNGAVNIENAHIVMSNDGYKGFQGNTDLHFKGCTIAGQPFLYGANATFEDCTFEQSIKDNYNVWTYAAKEVSFIDCVFNCDGRCVLIYQEGPELVQNVTFEGCTFNATSPANAGKAAIEIGASNLTTGIYTVTINNCVANGFDNGSVSGNTLWNVKDGNRAKVTVDGIEVF